MIEMTRSMPGFRHFWRRRTVVRLARALAFSLHAR